MTLVWKNVTLLFNVLAFICSIPTVFLLWFVSSLNVTLNSGSENSAYIKVTAAAIYFLFVNVILTVLLIKKKAVKSKKAENQQDLSVVNENIKFKYISFAFLFASIGILVFRTIYADDREILFTKGHLESEFYLFYFFTFLFTVLATAFIISLKNRKLTKVTTAVLGALFAIVMILNLLIKPNDYAALSREEKEGFLEQSSEYLEELSPEGIEVSNVKYNKSELGGKHIRVVFNYTINDCESKSCGPYKFDSDYHIKNAALINLTDSGQKMASDGQTIESENNKNANIVIKQKESVIEKEEKEVFIEIGNEADIKEQVVNLIEEDYDFSTNNGLPTRPNNHFDRLKFTKHRIGDYKKLLSIDANDFYDYIKSVSEYSHSDATEFVLYPLGTSFGKIAIEVSPEGYVVKGYAFKTVDSRARFVFELANGKTFTGVLERDHHFRADRVWVTVEDEGTSEYKKGEFIQVKY
ncbi:hypothetical protein F7731_24835 [Cytobacillus depressus]|uniref:Uncharacterized protein n=1 Tax=Cytobacillus depressus TaxID=1602942 RepID=A0A6L3UZX8_9BACI|nr:hypothetical protein F7731_24835 [Cytobacillus depressus]